MTVGGETFPTLATGRRSADVLRLTVVPGSAFSKLPVGLRRDTDQAQAMLWAGFPGLRRPAAIKLDMETAGRLGQRLVEIATNERCSSHRPGGLLAPKSNTTDESGSLAEMIRAARIGLGMSQAALASMASLHKETISRIERGHLFPSLHTSQRLGTELGLSPDDVARRHGLAARNTV